VGALRRALPAVDRMTLAPHTGAAEDHATRNDLQRFKEPAMSTSQNHRLYALAIAFVMTLATLGGIDGLAQHAHETDAQMAQQPAGATPRA
jgi:hypothetical protein